MKTGKLVFAALLSVATVAHAASTQAGGTFQVSTGDHFDCAPFPQNPGESPITGGVIVCSVNSSAPGPLAGWKFVGTIDGHQAKWEQIRSSDGRTWTFDLAGKPVLISIFSAGAQATMRVLAVSDFRLEQ